MILLLISIFFSIRTLLNLLKIDSFLESNSYMTQLIFSIPKWINSAWKTIKPELDDDSAYIKGIEQFVPSFDKIQEIFANDKKLRENTIILVSNSTNDGVSGAINHSDYLDDFQGDSQLKAFRQAIYKFVDGIFRQRLLILLTFRWKTNCPADLVIKECGSLKPCVHGCDAHQNEKYLSQTSSDIVG